jgi:hypothetical protein
VLTSEQVNEIIRVGRRCGKTALSMRIFEERIRDLENRKTADGMVCPECGDKANWTYWCNHLHRIWFPYSDEEGNTTVYGINNSNVDVWPDLRPGNSNVAIDVYDGVNQKGGVCDLPLEAAEELLVRLQRSVEILREHVKSQRETTEG